MIPNKLHSLKYEICCFELVMHTTRKSYCSCSQRFFLCHFILCRHPSPPRPIFSPTIGLFLSLLQESAFCRVFYKWGHKFDLIFVLFLLLSITILQSVHGELKSIAYPFCCWITVHCMGHTMNLSMFTKTGRICQSLVSSLQVKSRALNVRRRTLQLLVFAHTNQPFINTHIQAPKENSAIPLEPDS